MHLESMLFLQRDKYMLITKELHLKIKLLKNFDYDDLSKVLSSLHVIEKQYKKNKIILNEGQTIRDIGIILTGSVQVYNCDFFGNKSILTELEEGDTFGEVYALSDKIPIPLVVLATENTTVLYINVNELFDSNTNPLKQEFIKYLLKEFTSKNLLLSKKIEHLSKRSIREKLYSYLSSEAIKNKNSIFKIPFNRQELADYLSIDRSACSNELSKMKQEGILDFHKNEFILFKEI